MPQTAELNPLLNREFRIPFDRIRAEHVEPAIGELLRDARERLKELAADPAERTFDNTLLALEEVTERLGYAMSIAGHLESVATTPELRAAYNAVQPPVSEFYSSIPLNEDLWKQLKRYAGTAEAKKLTGARGRFLSRTLARRCSPQLGAAWRRGSVDHPPAHGRAHRHHARQRIGAVWLRSHGRGHLDHDPAGALA